MRWLPVLLFIGLVPWAAGHEGDHECSDANLAGLNHLKLWSGALAAGDDVTVNTAFNGCALLEDWWVLYWFDADAPIEVQIIHEGTELLAATVNGTEVKHVQLPGDGFPEVRLHNNGSADAAVRFYFDQTCDCSVKGSPVSGGPFWFNTRAAAGDDVSFGLQVVPIWTELSAEAPPPERIELQLAHVEPTPDGPVGASETLAFNTATDSCGAATRFIGCASYEFTSTGGMQYIYASASHDGDDRWNIQVRPEIDVDEKAPGLGVAGLLLLLALLARRR